MYQLSKFKFKGGQPDREEVESWAETYYFNLINILNAFFSYVDVNEALSRLKAIPFDELVREQLEDESPQVQEIAINRVTELLEQEIEVLETYAE